MNYSESIPDDGSINFSHFIVEDILELHHKCPGSLFQVASQFNCLEFPSPHQKPEDGISRYVFDFTQGPACSLACAASTVVRNYFSGQSHQSQINNLVELEKFFLENLGRNPTEFWEIKNGYSFSSEEKLKMLNQVLSNLSPEIIDLITRKVRVGAQTPCEVTFESRWKLCREKVEVSQVFCSALSCGYNYSVPITLWEHFAQIVLNGMYEGTILCGILEKINGSGTGEIYLTKLGGGVFGNENLWIARAIARALCLYKNYNVKVFLCHYMKLETSFVKMIDDEMKKNDILVNVKRPQTIFQ